MNNLIQYRAIHGMTQEDLGKKLGISKAAISFAEKNKISPYLASRCADVLGENLFNIMGSDVLRILPRNDEEKEILIKMIRDL